jgi:hypothetical protein
MTLRCILQSRATVPLKGPSHPLEIPISEGVPFYQFTRPSYTFLIKIIENSERWIKQRTKNTQTKLTIKKKQLAVNDSLRYKIKRS